MRGVMKLSSMCKGVMRLLGLTNFASLILLMVRIHSHCLQFWPRETYRSPANCSILLKYNQEVRGALLWWCQFVPWPKLIHRLSVEEVVTVHASTNWYSGHMNNLFGHMTRKEVQGDTYQSS